MSQAELSQKMNVIDTLHDFCKTERGDGDAAGDKRIDFMRGYIANLVKNKGYSTAATLNAMLSEITNSKVTAISKLEHESVDFFENTYPTLLNMKSTKKEVITYDTIFESWNENESELGNLLWKRLREDQEITILEIVKGKTKNPDRFESPDLARIGNFILNFFFGVEMVTPTTGIGSFNDVRVTFDAKTGLPGKIFTTMNQIKNIMFPQTIADSATTSLNILNGRSEYIFPGTNGKTIPIDSASFSEGEYSLSYTNKGFTNKNPFGFTLDIKNTTGNTISAPFGATQTEGPSVNYIIDILKLAKNTDRPNFTTLEKSKKANILSLGKALESDAGFKTSFVNQVKIEKDGLLPDIKRSGDHEAANVTEKTRLSNYAHLIFITIDILCALKSRNLGNPTIWHNNHHLILYRFPPKRELMEKIRYESFLRKLTNAIDTIDNLTKIKTSLSTNLTELQTTFETAKSGFFQLKKKGEISETAAESIVTILGRLRMIALIEQATAAKGKIGSFTKDLTATKTSLQSIQRTSESKLKAAVLTEPIIVDSVNVTTLLTDVDNAAKDLYKLVEDSLDLSIQEQVLTGTTKGQKQLEKQLSIKKEVFTTKKTTNGKDKQIFSIEDYPMFSYYPQNFLDLYESILTLQTLTPPLDGASSATKRKYNAAFDKTLGVYQSQVDSLQQQFSQESITGVEALFAILDVTQLKVEVKQGEDKADKRRAVALDYFKNGGLLAALDAYATTKGLAGPYALTLPLQGGGQQGGVQSAGDKALQYFDLSLLLFQVSTMAAAFFESAYAQEYPYWSLYYLHKELETENKLIKDINYLHSKLKTLYNGIAEWVKTGSAPSERAKFETIQGKIGDPNTKKYSTQEELTTDINEFATYFTLTEQPTLGAFLTKLTANKYTENLDAEFLLTEMLSTWVEGYIELQYNTAYEFDPATDKTSTLIVYLLSFISTTDDYYIYESNLNRRDTTAINKLKGELGKISVEKQILTILFLFACLENRMNPNKESSFIVVTNKNALKQFAAQDEWNQDLYSLLESIITSLQSSMTTKFPLTITNLSGGGKKKYAKKTRKQKRKQTKKSKRMTRRRKH